MSLVLVLCRSTWIPGQSCAEQPALFSTVAALSHLFPHGLSSPYFQPRWGRWHPWDKAACLAPLSQHGSQGWVLAEATALPTWHSSSGLSTPAQTSGPHGVLQRSLMLCVRDEITTSKGHTNHINGFIILIRPNHKHNWSAWQCSEAGPDQMAGLTFTLGVSQALHSWMSLYQMLVESEVLLLGAPPEGQTELIQLVSLKMGWWGSAQCHMILWWTTPAVVMFKQKSTPNIWSFRY